VTLAPASGQPMIKGPNFEPGATARRFGNPKAMGKTNLTFFMLQIALRARDRGRPDKSPRAHSPPRQPLHFASRCSTRKARGTVRRASRLPPTSRPKHILFPPQPGVSSESNLRVAPFF
jgi:hypothetical protein